MTKNLRLHKFNGLEKNHLQKIRHLLLLTLFLTAAQFMYAQLTITFNVQEPTCFGLPTGKVKALVSGGVAPYTYTWNTGATVAQLDGIPAGSYTVTVRDAAGTTAIQTIVINQPLLVSAAITSSAACASPFTLTAVGGGGAPPYRYYWTTNQTSQTISVTSGTYCVTLTDQNSCGAIACITVNLTPLDLSAVATGVTCPNGQDGSVTANPIGGTAPFTYQWSNGGTTQTINNLAPGTYSVTVTDKNGCKASASATVANKAPIVVTLLDTQPTCVGDNTGIITANATGGNPPYTYAWSTGATAQTLTSLGAGTYTVTVTDNKGCPATKSITLQPKSKLTLTVSGNSESCPDSNNGSITANPANGVPPYSFLWSNGATTQTITNLTPNTYSVTVTDFVGCKANSSFAVAEAINLTIVVTKQNATNCGGGNGTVNVAVTSGVAPYTYKWSNNATTASISNLGAGTYRVTVTDARGCTKIDSVIITSPPPVFVKATATDLVCFGANNGTAKATVTGGTAPFTYLWNTNATTDSIRNLSAGIYRVTVTDASGCTAVGVDTILQAPVLNIIINATAVVCGSENAGTATASATGGKAPYTFVWNTGATVSTIEELVTGAYRVTVTDANGCSAVKETLVTVVSDFSVTAVQRHVLCNGDNSGSILATATGGTAPYIYAWNNGQTTAEIVNLVAGTYTVTVTDKNGCKLSQTLNVTQPTVLSITTTDTDIDCFGSNDGTAAVTASGGTSPYTYKWSNNATTGTISNLSPGTYTVTVTDANFCTKTATITITQSPQLTLQTSKVDAGCNTGSTGTATATVSGGKAPYSYAWSNSGSTATITGLAAGTYTVTVTDANECATTGTVTINQPTNLTVAVNITKGTCDDSNNATIGSTVAGGTGPYTYKWSNNATTTSLTNVGAGTYTVTVTDAKGCTATGSVVLTAFKKPACSITLVNDSTAQVVVTGGTAPYTYQWSNSQSTNLVTKLQTGTYSVTVTDANGCTTSCSIEIKGPALIGDFVWLDNDRDGIQDVGEPGIPNVTVILTGTAESTPYSDTTKTNGNGIYQFQVPPPGTYKVTFVLPAGSGLKTTVQNNGDDTKDSDADPVTLMTQFVTVKKGDINLTLDAGFYDICVNLTNAGAIGYDQYLCGPGNNPAPIVEIAPPSGGSGPIEYLWMKSTLGGPFNDTNWQPIPNSNTKNYDPDPIFETTYFIRCTRRADCPYIETNIVTVVVGNETVAQIQGSDVVCEDTPVTFKAGGSGNNAAFQWDFGPAATPRYVTGLNANTTFSSFGTFEIKLTVTQGNCISTALKRITVSSLCGGLNIDVSALNDADVMVNWTLKEDNRNYQYIVEHSADGAAFRQLGQVVAPKRVVSGFKHYEHIAPAPKRGWNYYRVLVMDLDQPGRAIYSEIEEVVMYAESELMHYYPNPATDRLTVEIFDSLNDTVEFQLVNSNGTILQTIQAPKDATRQDIDLSALPAGAYFVKVKYGKIDVKVLKVMKN